MWNKDRLRSCYFSQEGAKDKAGADNVAMYTVIMILDSVLHLGQVGAWWGIVAGNGIGSLLLFLWEMYFLRALLRTEGNGRIEGLEARGAGSQ